MSAERDLWRVSDDFASLLRVRDILISEGEDTAPIEKEIAEYFSHDVTQSKIDTVIGALRHAETMESAAKAESDRCKKMAQSYATQREWLKVAIQNMMEMAGTKHLDGKTAGYLLLKANGGKASVEITDASLIPEDLVSYAGTISGRAWGWLRSYLSTYLSDNTPSPTFTHWCGREDVQMERIPHKGRIAAALEQACPGCGGAGEQAYYSEVYKGEPAVKDRCAECGGSGKAVVPGARFAPRGSSVIVK